MDVLGLPASTLQHSENLRRAYRVWEIAHTLGVGRSAIYGWIRDGKLKATKVGGITLILAPDFDAFLSHCGEEAHERTAKGM